MASEEHFGDTLGVRAEPIYAAFLADDYSSALDAFLVGSFSLINVFRRPINASKVLSIK
jgi:hypothetical protein